MKVMNGQKWIRNAIAPRARNSNMAKIPSGDEITIYGEPGSFMVSFIAESRPGRICNVPKIIFFECCDLLQ